MYHDWDDEDYLCAPKYPDYADYGVNQEDGWEGYDPSNDEDYAYFEDHEDNHEDDEENPY